MDHLDDLFLTVFWLVSKTWQPSLFATFLGHVFNLKDLLPVKNNKSVINAKSPLELQINVLCKRPLEILYS